MKSIENIYIPIYLSEDILQQVIDLKSTTKDKEFNIIGIYCPLVDSDKEHEFIKNISKIFNITIIDIKCLNNCEQISKEYEMFKANTYSYYCLKLYEQLKIIKSWAFSHHQNVVFS